MVTIAVDAMGGDNAPDINVEGTLEALKASSDLNAILIGDEKLLEGKLRKHLGERLSLVNAEEVISMEDHGASVIRRKKNSSIHVGLRLVKDGKADAFVSAGNSGAVMAGALLVLGRQADVDRPAILLKLPTAEGHIIILDGGANVDCKASHLSQFAEMGHVYASVVENMPRPRIAVLSNGSETHKGNELTRATHEILKERKDLRYIGYVEGYDLFRGTADVVVCDGFVGNVVLKLAEGLADTAFQWFRTELKRDMLGLLGMALMKQILRKFRAKFDYEPYGAAPLLGINGMVMIGHGKSTSVAIRNGILTAKKAVEESFIRKIGEQLGQRRKEAKRK